MNFLAKLHTAAVALLLVAGLQSAFAEVRQHVVKPGQTLYSIAKAYGVELEALKAANPKLDETSVPTGTTLIIPDATFKPIPMQSVPEGPAGNAPATSTWRSPSAPTHQTLDWSQAATDHWHDGVLNLALILPFNLDASSTNDNKKQMRSVEFYEGVLMAVDEIQQAGRHVKVQAYDMGSQPLFDILSKPDIHQADLIIAPIEENDVRQVALWGESAGTPVISPFTYSASMAETFSHLIQINPAMSMLYSQLTRDVIDRFKGRTFIFVTDQMGNQKSDPYPALLKDALRRASVPYCDLAYHTPEQLMACDSILGLKDEDLVFVPVTPQPEAMRRMFSGLQHVKILRDARYEQAIEQGASPADVHKANLSVLGYPEWMLSTQEFISYFYDLDVYMFSKFYANPFSPELNQFYVNFRQWFGKEPMPLAPKYALLGYDVAKYFLQELGRHGSHVEEYVIGDPEDGLQTYFRLVPGAQKGLYNQGFYLVHFTHDSTVEKILVE